MGTGQFYGTFAADICPGETGHVFKALLQALESVESRFCQGPGGAAPDAQAA